MRQLIITFLDRFPFFSWKLRGLYNLFFGEPEILLLNNLIKEFKNYKLLTLDIGANYGVYSYIFRNSEKNIAIEPVEVCYKFLQKAIGNQTTVIPYAVSDKEDKKELRAPSYKKEDLGKATFSDYGKKFEEKIEVNTTTVDKTIELLQIDLIFYDLIIVKIDVEGHENEVLKGMQKLIEHQNIILLIEIEEKRNPNEKFLYSSLMGYGFKPYVYKDKKNINKIFIKNTIGDLDKIKERLIQI